VYTTFSLMTYDSKDMNENRFLMATRGFMHMANTQYPVSIISKVKQDVSGSLYEVGTMTSDFVRNSYVIRSYKANSNREVKVNFDDVIFGSRQVSIQVTMKSK